MIIINQGRHNNVYISFYVSNNVTYHFNEENIYNIPIIK